MRRRRRRCYCFRRETAAAEAVCASEKLGSTTGIGTEEKSWDFSMFT